MSDEIKEFPTATVMSAATGIALCEGLKISDFHEVIEHVIGHPVWTHELAQSWVWDGFREELAKQLSAPIPTDQDLASKGHDAVLKEALETYGETMKMAKGCHSRSIDPVTTAVQVFDRRNKEKTDADS